MYTKLLIISSLLVDHHNKEKADIKGIVHFEMNFWYVSAYLKGIQEVFLFPQVFLILIFLGQTAVVYQSYNAGLGGPPLVHLKEHAQRSPN